MSLPLCAIGSAVLEVIGLNPVSFHQEGEAMWPAMAVFDDEPFYQSTALGERVERIALAARPHVMGGLLQYRALEAHFRRRDVVPFMRLLGVPGSRFFQVGRFEGDVGIRRLSKAEHKLAPDGIGYRHEFEAELIYVGRRGATR